MTSSTRLNKFLAHSAGISRREADEAIEQGKVRINGQVARLGAQVDPKDSVTLHGRSISQEHKYTFLLFHKPVGYVCSRRQQGDSPTIYSLFPRSLHHLKPVGRLDRDSSGLLLLTDDGDLAHSMTHPKFAKTKVYEVKLDHALEPLHQQMISDYGVKLEDGVSQFMIEHIKGEHYRITMREGRNRQIRRTFASLGYTVTELHRTNFGAYNITGLDSGKFQEIKNGA